jgi:hypothetical protein
MERGRVFWADEKDLTFLVGDLYVSHRMKDQYIEELHKEIARLKEELYAHGGAGREEGRNDEPD